jgi:hypothetical protein
MVRKCHPLSTTPTTPELLREHLRVADDHDLLVALGDVKTGLHGRLDYTTIYKRLTARPVRKCHGICMHDPRDVAAEFAAELGGDPFVSTAS